MLDELAAGLGPAGVGVVAHDAKEMMRSLLPLGVDMVGLATDTAVAAYLLDPSTDHYRLADLAERFLGVIVDDGTGAKGQGAFVLDPPEEPPDGEDRLSDEVLSAGRLASVLARLRAPLIDALAAVGEGTLYEDIEQPLVRVLARMEVVGIGVDREVLRSISAGLADECRSLEATIQELAGEPFKVNSVPQLRAVLYEKLGLTPVRKTKTGFSTDARTLELLRGNIRSSRSFCAIARWRSCVPPMGRAWRPKWPPTAASMPPSGRRWPAPDGCHRTGPTFTTSRSAPKRAGASAKRSCPPRDVNCWWPTTTRWNCGPSPICPGIRASLLPSPPARTSTARWHPRYSVSTGIG